MNITTHYIYNLHAFRAVQYAGFTMTPILGAMLSALAYQNLEDPISAHYTVNQYSLPVFFLMVICVLAILLLCSVFVDVSRGQLLLLFSVLILHVLHYRCVYNREMCV